MMSIATGAIQGTALPKPVHVRVSWVCSKIQS